MNEINVGDTVRHAAVPPGLKDLTVLHVKPCDGEGRPGDHPTLLVRVPETDELEWVCSRDFTKVGPVSDPESGAFGGGTYDGRHG